MKSGMAHTTAERKLTAAREALARGESKRAAIHAWGAAGDAAGLQHETTLQALEVRCDARRADVRSRPSRGRAPTRICAPRVEGGKRRHPPAKRIRADVQAAPLAFAARRPQPACTAANTGETAGFPREPLPHVNESKLP